MATPAGRTALLPWPCFSRHKSPTWLFRLDNNNLCCDGRGTCLVGKKSKAMESFGGEIGAEIGLERNLTMTSQNAWRVCTWKLELPPTGAGCGSGPRGVAMTYCKRGSACMDRTRRYLTVCIRYGVHSPLQWHFLGHKPHGWGRCNRRRTASSESNLANRIQHQQDQIR